MFYSIWLILTALLLSFFEDNELFVFLLDLASLFGVFCERKGNKAKSFFVSFSILNSFLTKIDFSLI
jgi:hypothetical protein